MERDAGLKGDTGDNAKPKLKLKLNLSSGYVVGREATAHAPLTHPSRTPHAPLTHPSRTARSSGETMWPTPMLPMPPTSPSQS